MQHLENRQRAFAAESALKTFAEIRGETDLLGGIGTLAEQNVIDLLTDLAHFCDAQNIPMERCLWLAQMHYMQERAPEAPCS